jgi:hypothetical protein
LFEQKDRNDDFPSEVFATLPLNLKAKWSHAKAGPSQPRFTGRCAISLGKNTLGDDETPVRHTEKAINELYK